MSFLDGSLSFYPPLRCGVLGTWLGLLEGERVGLDRGHHMVRLANHQGSFQPIYRGYKRGEHDLYPHLPRRHILPDKGECAEMVWESPATHPTITIRASSPAPSETI